MGIPLLFAAIILFAAAYQDNLAYFGTEIEKDLKGFLLWATAMALIGAIGMIPGSSGRRISNALFALVFIVILVANPGIFDNIKNGNAFKPVPPPKKPPAPGSVAKASTPGPGIKKTGNVENEPAVASVSTDGNIVNFPFMPFPNLGTGAIDSGGGSGPITDVTVPKQP